MRPGTKTVALAADAAEAGSARPTRPRWGCDARASAALVTKDFRLAGLVLQGVSLLLQSRDALEIASPEVVPVRLGSQFDSQGCSLVALGHP